MKLSSVLLCLFFSASLSHAWTLACLNDYVPNQQAKAKSKSLIDELTIVKITEPWEARRDRLRKDVEAGGDYKTRNDLASALMRTGHAKAAVQILDEIERTNPGEYRTASNLGTAHELAGNPQTALEWIRKGIERNPTSHEGTEWLHVKILEAKIALEADPKWLESHRVLGIDFAKETDAASVLGNRGEPLDVAQIQRALKYQLHERLQFVKPPEAIVGNLLVDLGTLIAQQDGGYAGTRGIFDLAKSYLADMPAAKALSMEAAGGSLAAIETERAEPRKLSWWEKLRHSGFFSFVLILIIGGLVALLVISLLRRASAAQHPSDR